MAAGHFDGEPEDSAPAYHEHYFEQQAEDTFGIARHGWLLDVRQRRAYDGVRPDDPSRAASDLQRRIEAELRRDVDTLDALHGTIPAARAADPFFDTVSTASRAEAPSAVHACEPPPTTAPAGTPGPAARPPRRDAATAFRFAALARWPFCSLAS
eukprot:6177609-Pleurochrysis_carterae.AAC.1